jgi:predicted nucleic acid-binding protein
MVPFDRFTVVLDACTLFPMLARDILLTLASHEFFSPKWSPRIRDEWVRNLTARLAEKGGANAAAQVERISVAVDRAFPDALVDVAFADSKALGPVSAEDRHVVATAIAAQADAIVTFNTADFAPEHLLQALQIEVKHPDDFVMDLVDLNEKRAAVAFRELRARKNNPPWDREELVGRTRGCGMVQTALWLANDDVLALI